MDGIAWAAGAMTAARTRLEIATQNLANVSTDGFARVGARGTLTPFGVEVRRFAMPGHGGLHRTGRDLDLAIVGAGTFAVSDLEGGSLKPARVLSRASATVRCATRRAAR